MPEIIAVSFPHGGQSLSAITEDPASWATLQTEVGELISIEAVALELAGFDPASDSLVLYADVGRQTSIAGAMRPVWSYSPKFGETNPAWLVPGATMAGGYRAECRLPVTMIARSLRLWTSELSVTVSGSVFYRPARVG